jgi:hypothetical protein
MPLTKLLVSSFFKTPEECDAFLAGLNYLESVTVEGETLVVRKHSRIVQTSNYHALFLGKNDIIRTMTLKTKKKYRHH